MRQIRTTPVVSRRTALAAMATSATAAMLPFGRDSGRADQRVVLVMLGGGVRVRDTFLHADRTPHLRRIGALGALSTSCKVPIVTPEIGQRGVFAGVVEEADPRPRNLRGPFPSIFEYLRKDASLAASDVWFVPSGTGSETLLGHSDHVDYGPRFGPSTFSPDAVVSGPLREALKKMDVAAPANQAEAKELLRLLASLDKKHAAGALANAPGGAALLALQRFVVAEIALKDDAGPGAGDARALRAAQALVTGARPRMCGVALRDAAIAGRSERDYLAVLGRVDAAIGALWDAIQADPKSKADTSLIVVSDHGRNRKAAPKGGLGFDDGSTSTNRVGLLCAGPPFKRKEKIRSSVNTIDVVPTICHLFGIKAGFAKGRVARTLLV
ncbi:MAG: hypothetical protein CMJ83_06835 [Planctomycetes bacterium]|nr:hypothetical protein [Planctomycetota bacterium]